MTANTRRIMELGRCAYPHGAVVLLTKTFELASASQVLHAGLRPAPCR
jgi:hypothetical protein